MLEVSYGPDERWVSVEEVAVHLRVGKDSIYRWVEAKGFPARRVGRLLRFRLSKVDDSILRIKFPKPSLGYCPRNT